MNTRKILFNLILTIIIISSNFAFAKSKTKKANFSIGDNLYHVSLNENGKITTIEEIDVKPKKEKEPDLKEETSGEIINNDLITDVDFTIETNLDIEGVFVSQVSGEVNFEDVEDYNWFKNDIDTAFKLGLINAKDANTFAPYENVNYKDAGTLINIFDDIYGKKNDSGEKMVLIEIEPSYYKEDIIREDLASIIYAYMSTQGFEEIANSEAYKDFEDSKDVDFYAKDALNWCLSNSIINGRSNNRLAPTETLTRAEFATILCRLEKMITKSL